MSKITSFSDFIYSDEKIYLCHTLQFNIIELDQITKLKIENAILTESLDGFTDEEISILTSEKFIVDDGFDDEQFRYLSANYLNTKNSDSHTIKLDIPITDRCNFICPYCFEKGRKRLGITKLDNSVFDNFKKSIFKYLSCRITDKTKKLYVVWYGGEPLVESDNILKLNDAFIEYCNAKNIIYEQEIITNGFLLNDYFIDNIKRQNLSHIQITLDGDKEYHNLRRTTPEKIDTFTTIIANILKCLNQKIEIVVRINLDRSNVESVQKLLDFLITNIPTHFHGKNFFIYFSRIFGSPNSYSLSDFEEIYNQLYCKIAQYGLNSKFEMTPLTAFCSAETNESSKVVDIFGNIYRCWNDVFYRESVICKIENVYENDEDYMNHEISNKYVNLVSLEKINDGNCLRCKYINICFGLCPDIRLRILNGLEENIYINEKCKIIAKKRLGAYLKGYLVSNTEEFDYAEIS